MKNVVRMLALVLAMLMVLTACSSAAPSAKPAENTSAASGEFTPKLDTQKSVELNAAVFFGNFAAFDQVINHFNEFYPNVVITYNQVSDASTADFLKENPSIDIFMTSNERGYPTEECVDLLAAGVDTSAIADGMLNSNTVDGKLYAIPMGLTLTGLVVNKTLLEKEGLSVPQTWEEFLSALETLKEKGYTPIQGPASFVSRVVYDMGMAMMSTDEALLNAVTSGDASGAAALKVVYERLLTLQENGYFSDEVNAEYPDDNYDGAIMKFFEGDVPFWVCDTEKVSGMKKRESKSETFSAEPFEYEFVYAPTGDNGVYEYIEPWYGFAVNKNSEALDYATEFLRFMARTDELNTLASVKGVPSIAKESTDERYAKLNSAAKVEAAVVSDGTVPTYFGTLMCNAGNALLTGDVSTVDEAVALFVAHCAESLQ